MEKGEITVKRKYYRLVPLTKVLNLYAGIGGNRKLWKDVRVTAIENDPATTKEKRE